MYPKTKTLEKLQYFNGFLLSFLLKISNLKICDKLKYNILTITQESSFKFHCQLFLQFILFIASIMKKSKLSQHFQVQKFF